MTENQKQLYKLIDEILWNEWDPIGVNEFPEARDEYHSYIPTVFDLITSGAGQRAIADYLFQIETVNMGLLGNIENCSQVARKIDEIIL